MPDFNSYIICTLPRSGSTLLCDMLKSTCAAGQPDSFYRAAAHASWAEHFGLSAPTATPNSAATFFAAAHKYGKGQNRIFGMRLMKEDTRFFAQNLHRAFPGHSTDKDAIIRALGSTLFIHLSRTDKIAQAISYVKAGQSGLWHAAPDGTEIERLSPAQPLVFDPKKLHQTVEEFTAQDQQWSDWFAQMNVEPFRIEYEEMSANPMEPLENILAELGFNPTLASGITPRVAKLANAHSQDWYAQYLKHYPKNK